MSTETPHLYNSVTCPRCHQVKVTRYPRFRHCKRVWKTLKNLTQGTASPRAMSAPSDGAMYTMEATW